MGINCAPAPAKLSHYTLAELGFGSALMILGVLVAVRDKSKAKRYPATDNVLP